MQVSKDELKKLFVHGIPATAQPADLLHLFDSCTCACPAVQADLKERRGGSFSIVPQQCVKGFVLAINAQCTNTSGSFF